MIFIVLAIIVLVIMVIAVYYDFYVRRYLNVMKKAEDMLDFASENAGIVVKKDDRIIECNGMMIPMQCKKCRFGTVKKGNVECFVPDYDGIPTIGLKR